MWLKIRRLVTAVAVTVLLLGVMPLPVAGATTLEVAPAVSAVLPSAGVADVGIVPAGVGSGRYWAVVRCHVVKKGAVVGYVSGEGNSSTKDGAVANAKKDADRKIPAGAYKRHCQVKNSNWNGFGGGGGRFGGGSGGGFGGGGGRF